MTEPIKVCRFCDLPVEGIAATAAAYWRVYGVGKQPQFPCHVECKRTGQLAEAFACQTIDADCNDCRHFVRFPHGDATRRSDVFPGHCARFNKTTRGRPNFASLLPCFEHRRGVLPT